MSKCEIRSLGVQDCEFMQVEKISNGYNIIWKIPAGGDHSKHSKKLIIDAFECNLLAEAFHVILIWICKNERRCRLPLLHLQMRNRPIICHFYALFKKTCNFVSNWMIFKAASVYLADSKESSKFKNDLFFEKVTFFSFSHTSKNV